jgi:hypothetical protein
VSLDYSDSENELGARGPVVDRLLAYLARLFRDEPFGASVAAGFVLAALTNSGIAMFLGAAAAYVLTEPLRRPPKQR